MKIAITADVHLTGKEKHPERWDTFENLLKDIQQKEINHLIISGDLFNDDYHNHSEFDELISKYQNIRFIIIPGNHDHSITQKAFIANNIVVYDEPEIINFGNSSFPFLFLPYKKEVSMGEEIAYCSESLPENEWILVSHGDWADSIKAPNPIEPGIYMPLSRNDLNDYKPYLILLGHIHKPLDDSDSKLYYLGSPCGLDITETGRRRYLILDIETLEIDSIEVDSELIYFDEIIIVYPMKNEEKYWENEVKKIKDKWNLTSEEKSKAFVRIKVMGYSSNKRKLKEYFDSEFKDYSFWNGEGVDVSEVSISESDELLNISQRVMDRINEEFWEGIEREPSKEEIIYQALKAIYNVV